MTGSAAEPQGEARSALRAIVDDPAYGIGTLSDPNAVSNLLKDYLPDSGRERGILVAAAESDVVGSLREHLKRGMDSETAVGITAAAFANATSFTPQACIWATRELAVAAGLARADTIDAYPSDPAGTGPQPGGPPAGPAFPGEAFPAGNTISPSTPMHAPGPVPGPGSSSWPAASDPGRPVSHPAAGSAPPPGPPGSAGGYPPGRAGPDRGGRAGRSGGWRMPEGRLLYVLIGVAALVVAAAIIVIVLALQAHTQAGSTPAPAQRQSSAAGASRSPSATPSSPAQPSGTATPTAAHPGRGITPLKTLLRGAYGTDCTDLESQVKYPTIAYWGCRYTTQRGVFYFAGQFATTADEQKALDRINGTYKFDGSTAGPLCPPPKGFTQGLGSWHSKPDQFQHPKEQQVECFFHGELHEPMLIWTMPSEHAIWVAGARTFSNVTMRVLLDWFKKIDYQRAVH